MPVTVKEILDDYRRAIEELKNERKEKSDSMKLGADARTPQH